MGTPRDTITAERLAELREIATMALDMDLEMPQSLKEDEGVIECVMASAWLHDELVTAGATADQATDIVKRRAKSFGEKATTWAAAGRLLAQFRLTYAADQAYEALVSTFGSPRDFNVRLLRAVRVLPPREAAMLISALDVLRSAQFRIRPKAMFPTREDFRASEAAEAAVFALLALAEGQDSQTPEGT